MRFHSGQEDGKPLSEEEQKKKTISTKGNSGYREARRQERGQEEKAKEEGKEKKDDDVGIETFLRACQFVNPRRERFRGQDVLVFDSSLIPTSSSQTSRESSAELAGVIWIDEKARDVARLEAYFVGDFRFGGG